MEGFVLNIFGNFVSNEYVKMHIANGNELESTLFDTDLDVVRNEATSLVVKDGSIF